MFSRQLKFNTNEYQITNHRCYNAMPYFIGIKLDKLLLVHRTAIFEQLTNLISTERTEIEIIVHFIPPHLTRNQFSSLSKQGTENPHSNKNYTKIRCNPSHWLIPVYVIFPCVDRMRKKKKRKKQTRR